MRTVKQAQKQFLRKREAWSKASQKYHAEQKALVQEIIKGGCDHSETVDYSWEWDSGYGRQSRQTGKVCVYCGWKSSYADGRFCKPEDLVDYNN